MPLGFLVPIIFYWEIFNIKAAIKISLLVPFGIELTKLVLRAGAFDIGDITLNSIGGFLGYLVLVVALKILVLVLGRRGIEEMFSVKKLVVSSFVSFIFFTWVSTTWIPYDYPTLPFWTVTYMKVSDQLFRVHKYIYLFVPVSIAIGILVGSSFLNKLWGFSDTNSD